MGGERHSQAALPLGGWVGLCGGLDECGISRPLGDSIHGPSSPKRFAIPSLLLRPNCEILLHLTFHEAMLPDSLQVRRTQIQWRCGNKASLTDVTYLNGWKELLSLKTARKIHVNRGADKSLARLGRKQANVSVRMAWISFDALPYREKKTWWKLASPCCWNRARPWYDSELVSFLVRLRTYQYSGIYHVLVYSSAAQFPTESFAFMAVHNMQGSYLHSNSKF